MCDSKMFILFREGGEKNTGTSVFISIPYIQKMFFKGGLSQGVRGFNTGSP